MPKCVAKLRVFFQRSPHRCVELSDKTAAEARDDFYKNLAKKNIKKITVYNGPLECRFVQFALYPGKKGG